MNRFLLILLTCALLCGCNSTKKYNEKLKRTTQLMAELTFYSEHITDDYTNVWKEAIYDNEYQGAYCSDFNEALSLSLIHISEPIRYIDKRIKGISVEL